MDNSFVSFAFPGKVSSNNGTILILIMLLIFLTLSVVGFWIQDYTAFLRVQTQISLIQLVDFDADIDFDQSDV